MKKANVKYKKNSMTRQQQAHNATYFCLRFFFEQCLFVEFSFVLSYGVLEWYVCDVARLCVRTREKSTTIYLAT